MVIDSSDQDPNESDYEYVKDSDLPSDEIGEKDTNSVPQFQQSNTIDQYTG